ncbi:hypothetical protein SUGI_0198140 [Cryptomeria japonica]|nr:hypothetical protein SUGI_0198140 [Cryptomeria japonica]
MVHILQMVDGLEAKRFEAELEDLVTFVGLWKIGIFYTASSIALILALPFATHGYEKHPEKSFSFNIFMYGYLVGLLALCIFIPILTSRITLNFRTKNLILFWKVLLSIVTLIFLFSFLAGVDLVVPSEHKFVAVCVCSGLGASLLLFHTVSLGSLSCFSSSHV